MNIGKKLLLGIFILSGFLMIVSPTFASKDAKVVSIAEATFNKVALKSDGTVWTWGPFIDGSKQIKGLNNIVKVVASSKAVLALDQNGTVWTAGNNENGELGNGLVNPSSYDDGAVKLNLQNIVDISASFMNFYALTKDGEVWIWGGSVFKPQGAITIRYGLEYPIKIPHVNHVKFISGDNTDRLYMQKDDGSVWYYPGKELGDLFYNRNDERKFVYYQDGVQQKSGWMYNTIWGTVSFGSVDEIPELKGAKKLWINKSTQLAEMENGDVWRWSDFPKIDYDRLQKVALDTTKVQKIIQDYQYVVTLNNDGTVCESYIDRHFNIGKEISGCVDGLNNVRDILTHQGYLIALKKDGTIWEWLNRTYSDFRGENPNPVRVSWTEVAIGYDTEGHWAQKEINQLLDTGILNGFDDRTLRPDSLVTREQFVKMLIQAKKIPLEMNKADFQDVGSDRWSNGYIGAAVKAGIVVPNEYGKDFLPWQPISRFEMATMAARALGLTPNESAIKFTDNQEIKNQRGYIGAAVQSGIINGFEDGTFKPYDNSTRAQAAVIITRILDYKK